MKLGFHLIQLDRLTEYLNTGEYAPASRAGVLDLSRIIQGLLHEPPPAQPLHIFGLERLLSSSGEQTPQLLNTLRTSIVEGKYYFEWKEIPLVFLVNGTLQAQDELAAPTLKYEEHRWDLSPLFGRYLSPKLKDDHTWWWSPTLH